MHWHHHRSRRRRREHHRHGGFGPWGFRGRFFRAGELRIALLSLLAERPRHGYELMKQLEERSGGLYRASAGSVYPTLQQLEDEGLATATSSEGKKVYRLTPAGQEELELEADTAEDIWRRADEWGAWGFGHAHAHELWRLLKALYRTSMRALEGSNDPARFDQVESILRDARRRIRSLAEGDEERDRS